MEIDGIEPYVLDRLIELSGGFENIAFITLQGLDTGSDVDVYCVMYEGESRVVIEEVNGVWHEYFIDTWADMQQKLENRDEIARNFICVMPLRYSHEKAHADAVDLVPNRFDLPEARKQLLYYRIKVIASKLGSAKTPEARSIFSAQLVPHLITATFAEVGLWPSPPKEYVERLMSIEHPMAQELTQVLQGNRESDHLSEIYAHRFTGMSLSKQTGRNSLTYLG